MPISARTGRAEAEANPASHSPDFEVFTLKIRSEIRIGLSSVHYFHNYRVSPSGDMKVRCKILAETTRRMKADVS
jgi:hypothetical protein